MSPRPCRWPSNEVSWKKGASTLIKRATSPSWILKKAVRACSGPPGMGDKLWALDFDGVICDSCGESALSAWKAAAKVWPEYMIEASIVSQKSEVLKAMRTVRPVIETGYENIIQLRCLLEGVPVETILDKWEEVLEDGMHKWQLDRSELVQLFGTTRDEWMAEDLQSWLAPNTVFDGLPSSLKKAMENEEVYIVTTKQARFTAAILSDMAGIDFPMDRIYSTTVSGEPKTGILAMLRQKYPERKCLFIEDKLSTLDKVSACPSLDCWQLYLASWGYNTQRERERAAQNPRIQIVDLDEFRNLLVQDKVPASGL